MTKPQALLRPAPALATLRLNCHAVTQNDAGFYADLFGRPETVAHRPSRRMLGPAEAMAMVRSDLAHRARHGFGRWTLCHAGDVIGLGGLTVKTQLPGLNLSYHLLPEWWGHGFASEFVGAAVDYARDALGAGSVYGLVRPSNIASIRVLEKAGFRDEGMHRISGGAMRELRLTV